MMFNFEDWSLNEQLEISRSKFDKMNGDPDTKFGIIMVTYQRGDGKTPEYIKEAIDSVKAQKHKNWKIYLIGDDYDDNDEFEKIAAHAPSDKIWYQNMDLPGERLRFEGNDLWHCGSNCGANLALDQMKKDGVEWVTRLDHDDIWTPDHLTNFSKVAKNWPEVKFMGSVSKVARYKGGGKGQYFRPDRGEKSDFQPNTPKIRDCWHSALCWNRKDLDLRYRNVREQMLTEPVRDEPRGGDKDMVDRLMMGCEEKNHSWMMVPKPSVKYRNKQGRLPR
jgi:glycosyltransferase involved in cell wall biosynthesis